MEADEKVTPMMVQYREIKEKNQDKVLFFRLGDFYEMFDNDAVEVSRILNLTLTHRASSPMCGIPYHAAKSYIRRLLDVGKKIAICEQMELTDDPKKLARREVIQVVTPATVIDDDFLDAKTTNYLLAVHKSNAKQLSVSFADITSGEFVMTSVPIDRQFASLSALLGKTRPREILVEDDDYFTEKEFQERIDATGAMVTKLPSWNFKRNNAYKILCGQVGTSSLKGFGFSDDDPALESGGALLSYLKETAMANLHQISSYQKVDDDRYLLIDESSQRNLELLQNLQDGSQSFSLFSAIDQSVTSGGARMLKKWISFPLREAHAITFRQDWVTFFHDHPEERKEVRETLRKVLDLQRLSSRIAMHRSMPQDLVGIEKTTECFLSLMQRSDVHYQQLFGKQLNQETLSALITVMEEIKKGINEQTQGPFAEGEVINAGYDAQLDSLRDKRNGGKDLLDSYLDKVKEATGITNLKLSSNKIIGHYLEVSKGQTDRVPHSFYRKQTLVNAERYTTDELVSLESDIMKSGFAAEAREKEVYETILQKTAGQGSVLQEIALFLSTVDVLSSLAECAVQNRYHKPQFVKEDILIIKAGRHPVVERQIGEENFVANDLDIPEKGNRFCLITGPNMAGKSTFLRQNALIVLLAQIGSYVPADSVTMAPIDRLFCRVGASDNLARGESTFLVEMQEASLILRLATEKSFVIVDELGRGTSTQDGMAIAYAVMQALVARSSKTLFATHYHELADMDIPHVRRLTLKVAADKGTVVFLRKVIEGVAESSYGLHVAKMAGVPYTVLRDALDFQKRHDENYFLNQSQPSLFSSEEPDDKQKGDLAKYDRLTELLDAFDLNKSTPLDALTLVSELKKVILS